MKRYDANQAQADLDQQKIIDKTARKNRLNTYADLEKFATQIDQLAARPGTSKRSIKKILKNKYSFDASSDRIYRFVKLRNGGVWPNSSRKPQG